jgi:chromate transporter
MTLLGLVAANARVPATGPVAGAIHGLEVAAVAIVTQALLTMIRTLAPDLPRGLIAAAATPIVLVAPSPLAQLTVIAVGAVIGRLVLEGRIGEAAAGRTTEAATRRPVAGRRSEAMALAIAFLAVVVGSQVLTAVTGRPDAGLVAAFVRAGALVFGGGHVVLPLLDTGVVRPGWVTEDQFLAGYGAAQALPGPLFSFAAYLGGVASVGPGGVAGSLVALVAIFLPGALLVLAALPVIGWLRGRPGVAASLAGVNAAVVGILAAALITPVMTGALTSVLSVVVAVAGIGLLSGLRVPPIVVVAGSAAAMAAGALVAVA